jgi:hypothetical protein
LDEKPLIGVSILVVVLLVMGSLNNVVGYQSVQTSQENIIKERINQRELLFQTIVDIANNKEIQRIILKTQMSRGIFQTSEFPVVTKTQIRQMYFVGLILLKLISKSRIQSILEKYQLSNQEMQKEISSVVEKNATFNEEIIQLSALKCDCQDRNYQNDSIIDSICFTLFIIMMVFCFGPLMILQGILYIFKYSLWNLYLFLYYTIGAPFLIIAGSCTIMMKILKCWPFYDV